MDRRLWSFLLCFLLVFGASRCFGAFAVVDDGKPRAANRDKPTHTASSKLRALGVANVIAEDGVVTASGSKASQVGADWYHI